MPNYKKNDRSGAKAPRRQSLLQEIQDIDSKLLSILSRRNQLMGKVASKRRQKGLPLADPEMERRLFETWSETSSSHKFDSKSARRIFEQVNNLAYTAVASPESRKSDAYILSPPQKPVKVDVDGPRSLFQTKLYVALAAACGAEASIGPVVLNDSLVQVIKAFNQAGAHLSWNDDRVESRPEGELSFEEKLVFVGDSPLNLYLITAFGMSITGKFKMAGSAEMKFFDTRPMNNLVSGMGARLNTLDLHSHGLPARLECGGRMASKLTVDDSTDPQFAAALALAAWTYPQGLTLKFESNWKGKGILADTAAVLKSCGIDVVMTDTEIKVPHCESINFSKEPEIALDPEICSPILAIPAFSGGEVSLKGTWPSNPDARKILDTLRESGVNVEIGSEGVTASRDEEADGTNFDCLGSSELFPLELALAIKSGREATLPAPEDDSVLEQGVDLLERLGIRYLRTENGLALTPGRLRWESPWTAPSPFFGMALGLLAWIRPGLSIENPGEITSHWPRFWTLYNGLPEVTSLIPPKKEKKDDSKSNRKRVRID